MCLLKRIDDKRQITAIFTVSMTGKFLPTQLVSEGKTCKCLPKSDFPGDFNITFSDSNWSNREKSFELFQKVIFPYLI